MRRACVALLALSCACAEGEGTPGPGTGAAARPNVVLIVADDLGFGDVGYQGGYADTPNIDALAREGVVLERFYVQPLCSPTRAALMTGRQPIRLGLARAALAPWREAGLDPSETTLAEVLAGSGYEARGLFGKWHLGHLDRDWHPLSHGFTEFRGHYNGAIDYFDHTREGERDWHEDFEPMAEQGYATDLIADAAAGFIREHSGRAPFLCVVSFNAPHAPLQVPDAYAARYAHLAGPGGEPSLKQVMAGMITSMDEGLGRVLAALEASGEAEDTVVWFLSDNGGIEQLPANNAPLRGDKGTVLEGGVRVPSCVRWPARLAAGGSIERPTSVLDVLPTLAGWAGAPDLAPLGINGLDLGPALAGSADVPGRELYFYTAMEGDQSEQLAVRTPRWKLIVLGPVLGEEGPGEAHQVLLFEIADDPEERRDVASEHPDVVARLAAKLAAFRSLQPDDAIAPYLEGSEGFVAPRDWRIPD